MSLMLWSSCDYLTRSFCGEFPLHSQEMLKEVKNEFGSQLEMEPIPCEYIYINAHLKQSLNDTALADELHKLLYVDSLNHGWQDIKFYDPDRNYLFTHDYQGNIYR